MDFFYVIVHWSCFLHSDRLWLNATCRVGHTLWLHNVSPSFFGVCQRHHTTIHNHKSTKKASDRSLDHRERKPNKSAPKESIWIQRIHRPQISRHDSPCHATIWCEEYGSDVGKCRTSATHPKTPHCTARSRSGRLQIKRPLLKRCLLVMRMPHWGHCWTTIWLCDLHVLTISLVFDPHLKDQLKNQALPHLMRIACFFLQPGEQCELEIYFQLKCLVLGFAPIPRRC